MTNEEINAWIAEHVMGKCVFEPHHINNALCSKCRHDCSFDAHKFPNYTTDPAAAMEVLKKCVEKIGWSNGIVIDKVPNEPIWIVAQEEQKEDGGEAETLELAIALFAKKLFTK